MNDKINISQKIIDKYNHLGLNQDNLKVLIDQYNKYIASIVDKRDYNYKNIHNCSKHRVKMVDKGKRPPCHACKYVKRSMNILMDYMFVDKRDVSQDRIVFLLQNSFYDRLRLTRVNHMRLLASNIASMGNIMFSCADNEMFSFNTIRFIAKMLEDGGVRTKKRDEKYLKFIYADLSQKSKIDSSLLYYFVAFRFYSIAKLDKDASDCLLKMVIIINNVLSIEYRIQSDGQANNKLPFDKKMYSVLKQFLDILYSRYAKIVNRQLAYSGHYEVQDIRDILHINIEEDINLTRSHLYSELEEVIWHIIDSEIKMLDLLKKEGYTTTQWFVEYSGHKIKKEQKHVDDIRQDLIIRAFKHFKYIGVPHNTFYNEVIYYYARFNINNYIFEDLLNISNNNNDNKSNTPLSLKFLLNYNTYVRGDKKTMAYDSLFNICKVEDRQNVVEFLIEDSITCLTEILYTLTPFNHISSFSNNFVADIYNRLWKYAKIYETLGLLYDYKTYQNTVRYEEVFEQRQEVKYFSKTNELKEAIISCCPYIKENNNLKEKYGTLRNRMFGRLNHNIDERTIKYTISQYAAEMALRYYSLIESSYYEGTSYRNQISRNYLLNDDLDNDTWLFNTAIERFRVNTGNIEKRKTDLSQAIRDTRFYKYESYVRAVDRETEQFDIFDEVRFKDSLFTNTEL